MPQNDKYVVRVGIDTGKFAKYQSDIQNQLNRMSKHLSIAPQINKEELIGQINEIGKTLKEQVYTQKLIQLKIDDEQVINSLNNISANINQIFNEKLGKEFGTNIFRDFKSSLDEVNASSNTFKENNIAIVDSMNEVFDALLQGTESNTKLSAGIDNIANAYRSLGGIYKKFINLNDKENGITDLKKNTDAVTKAVTKLINTVNSNKLKIHGQLSIDSDDIEKIGKRIDQVSNTIKRSGKKIKIPLKPDTSSFKADIDDVIKKFKSTSPISIKVTEETFKQINSLIDKLKEAAEARKDVAKKINIKAEITEPTSSASKNVTAALDKDTIAFIKAGFESVLESQTAIIDSKKEELELVKKILDTDKKITDEQKTQSNISNSNNSNAGSSNSSSSRSSSNKVNIDRLYSQFDNDTKKLTNLKNNISGNANYYAAVPDKVSDIVQKINNALNENSRDKLKQLITDGEIDNAKEFLNNYREILNTAKEEESQLKSIEKLYKQRISLLSQAQKVARSVDRMSNTVIASDGKEFDKETVLKNIRDTIVGIESIDFSQLNEDMSNESLENTLVKIRELDTSVKNLVNSIASLKDKDVNFSESAKNLNKMSNISQDLVKINNEYLRDLKKHPELLEKIRKLQQQIYNNQINSNEAKKAISEIVTEMDRLGITTDTIWKKLRNTFGVRLKSALAGNGVYLIQRALRQVYQDVVSIDSAMTELKKVTDATQADYISFLDNASTRAKKLGATLTEVVNASADFARLGYSIPEASDLADAAIIYQNVGDGVESIDEATSSIISTMQAFNIEAKNAIEIVDKYNAIGNNFATTSGDVGVALKKSASAMKEANNSLDETIALYTAAQTTVQDKLCPLL